MVDGQRTRIKYANFDEELIGFDKLANHEPHGAGGGGGGGGGRLQ